MALAALIFGKWKPIPTFAACLFFGLTDALQIRLQGAPFFGGEPIPVQFIQILPYVFTVFVLAGFMGKSRAPKALGAPWLGMLIISGFFLVQGCEANSPPALRSPEARFSKENAEILAEMVRVVFNREPQDRKSFQAYHSSLNQGASLEGILNGLTHSSSYRELEASSPPAPPLAKAFFIDELLRIQTGMEKPFSITPESGKPLRVNGVLDGKKEYPAQLKPDKKNYELWFATSSLPTLKRVLCEIILQKIESAGPGVGAWYGETAARLAGAGVDFGLSQRNLADGAFHKKWAETHTQDRLVWESLNRYLRVLNHLNKEPSK